MYFYSSFLGLYMFLLCLSSKFRIDFNYWDRYREVPVSS